MSAPVHLLAKTIRTAKIQNHRPRMDAENRCQPGLNRQRSCAIRSRLSGATSNNPKVPERCAIKRWRPDLFTAYSESVKPWSAAVNRISSPEDDHASD